MYNQNGMLCECVYICSSIYRFSDYTVLFSSLVIFLYPLSSNGLWAFNSTQTRRAAIDILQHVGFAPSRNTTGQTACRPIGLRDGRHRPISTNETDFLIGTNRRPYQLIAQTRARTQHTHAHATLTKMSCCSIQCVFQISSYFQTRWYHREGDEGELQRVRERERATRDRLYRYCIRCI